MHKIIVEISPEGDVKMDPKGIKGPGCKAATKPFEELLGKVTSDVTTSEYHQAAVTNQLKLGTK